MALLFASPFMVRTKATRSHVYTFHATDPFSATISVRDAIGRQSSVGFSVIRDTTPPTLTLEAVVQGTDVHVTWSAADPSPGSGLDAGTCLLEVREDEEIWQTFSTLCEGDDATHDGQPGHTYTFRLSASDNVGNEDSLEVQAVVPYVTKYYYANGQRVAMQKEGVVYYVHTDHLGSTSVLSDESGQQAGDRVAYLPYGGVRLGDASTLPTDYGFTGQRLEAGLGLMHYGARFYSPKLGRFVSADSIVPGYNDPQALNRYAYAVNNPLRYVDPSGHTVESALASIREYHRDIISIAEEHDIDPLLLAGVVFAENRNDYNWIPGQDWSRIFSLGIGGGPEVKNLLAPHVKDNPSLGITEISVAVAAMMDHPELVPANYGDMSWEERAELHERIAEDLSSDERQDIIDSLSDPKVSLEYSAKYLDFLASYRDYGDNYALWLSDYNRGLSDWDTTTEYGQRIDVYREEIENALFQTVHFHGELR